MNEVSVTPMHMLEMAVSKGVDLPQLEKLMDLNERWKAGEARKSYYEAMAGFQSELEPIIKRRKAHNSTYADIDDIATAIRPILEKYQLSYRFEQTQGNAKITVTCIVSHAEGHSEKMAFSAPPDTSGGKNTIQTIASTVTYLRRYTLTGSLGITTGNDDNDGGKPSVTVDELLEYMDVVREEVHSIAAVKLALSSDDYSTAKEAWAELDEKTMRALWRAPSKGGIFTTEERTKMKSTEWGQA